MAKATKIEVKQKQSLQTGRLRYIVASLTNRTRPEIGCELSEDDLKQLISENDNLTVTVKPGDKQ